MSQIITDLSVQKEWVARRGSDNHFTITFTNSGAFNISGYVFVLNIRKIGANTQELQLTEGNGLTNNGATGILNVLLSEEDTEDLLAQSYFYSLEYTVGGNTYGLLHGTLNLIQQYNKNQVSTSLTIPVNLSGTALTMSVSLGGSPLNVYTGTTLTTLTPDGSYDAYELTAQASALTIANPSTDYANFDGFMARVYTASAQTLTMQSKYRALGEAFPASTTAGKVMVITAVRDSTTDKYDTKISIEV